MLLEIDQVNKEYDEIQIVKNFSYNFTPGVYGLLGVNGVGKTTLIKLICTLIKPSSGNIYWNGNNIYTLNEIYREQLGYLPQEFGFYPDIKVKDYMLYISSLKGIPSKIAKNKIDELLKIVSLEKAKNKKMKVLSIGMLKRVGIAQALINDPKILILDEPTAGLDPQERINFRNVINNLSESRIVILSTHIVSDVEFIAKEIIFMDEGSIRVSGTANKVIKSMNKNVWELEIKRSELQKIQNNNLIVAIRNEGELVKLRILSTKQPSLNAIKVSPNLEDAFLDYYGKNGGLIDAII